MSALSLSGAASPSDPFQGPRATTETPIQALARQWEGLTRLIEDDAAYKAAERAAPPYGGDVWFARIWEERDAIEAQISANAEPTVEAIVVKLRMMAWHRRYMDGGRHGDIPPGKDENTITSALAAAMSVIGRTRA
jgi:hypothetical protein